jgi:uncharacterized membrane protein YdjX (TVP38/TMEM64 family)
MVRNGPFRLWLRAAILVAFAVALWLLHRELNLWQYFKEDRIGPTLDAIRSSLAPYGFWAPAVFAVLCSLAMLLNAPTALIVCLSVLLFGYAVGGILSFLILWAGLSLIYLVAQAMGRPLVKRLFGTRLERIERRLARRELVNVILIRLVLYMNPVSNWLLSVSGIRYRNLILGTLLGAGPGILLNVWLAGVVLEYLRSGSTSALEHWQWLIPVGLAALLLVSMRIWDRRRRER